MSDTGTTTYNRGADADRLADELVGEDITGAVGTLGREIILNLRAEVRDRHARRMVEAIAKNGVGSREAAAVLISNAAISAARLDAQYEAITALHVALDALTARLAGLEASKSGGGVKWAGVHAPGRRYAEGQLTTRSGSLWLCKTSTSETPGASASWVLVCKSGQVSER